MGRQVGRMEDSMSVVYLWHKVRTVLARMEGTFEG